MKHDPEILAGIPRGVWVSHWADEQEEAGEHFASGTNLDDVAPPTPRWAKKWAREVADKIVAANNVVRGRPVTLAFLYSMVKEAGYPYDKEHFGFHLGMQTAGHGVSWSDDSKLPHDAIEVPYREFYR